MSNKAITSPSDNKAWKTAMRALDTATSVQSQLDSPSKQVVNSAAVPAAESIVTPPTTDYGAAAKLPPSGKLALSGGAFVRASVIDTACTFQYIRDPDGAAVPIGPVMTSDSSHVNANAQCTLPDWVDTPPTGAVLIYGVIVTCTGHTVEVLAANESSIRVSPAAS
jgi:hypothetical protein